MDTITTRDPDLNKILCKDEILTTDLPNGTIFREKFHLNPELVGYEYRIGAVLVICIRVYRQCVYEFFFAGCSFSGGEIPAKDAAAIAAFFAVMPSKITRLKQAVDLIDYLPKETAS